MRLGYLFKGQNYIFLATLRIFRSESRIFSYVSEFLKRGIDEWDEARCSR